MKPGAPPNHRHEESPRPAGRNESCLCGSGRKYKKCCLPLQQERGQWDPLEDSVRALVEDFVHDERFDEERERAISLFGIDRDTTDLADERLFYDWYIYDYVVPRKGKSLVRLLEKDRTARQADDEKRRTLRGWASSTFSFLEVLEVKRGTGFRVKDICRGSEYFIWDVSISNAISRYDILYFRPYPVGRIMRAASGIVVSPHRLKSSIEGYVKAGYQDFTARNEGATIDDYLRNQSLSIIKYLETAFTSAPTVLTSEGDVLLFSSCEYKLSDPKIAVKLLDSCRELVDVGEENDALRYDWVKKVDERRLESARDTESIQASISACKHTSRMKKAESSCWFSGTSP